LLTFVFLAYVRSPSCTGVFIASGINKLTANLANLTKSFLDATASLRRSHAQITRLADDSFADAFIRASGWRRVFRINKSDATHMCL